MVKLTLSLLSIPLLVYGQIPASSSMEALPPRAIASPIADSSQALPTPTPISFKYSLSDAPEFTLGQPTLDELSKVINNPRAVGFTRPMPADALGNGAWETIPDGTQIWRLTIRSPGAVGLRLHFKDFSVGNGQVWIYSGDRKQVFGPYSGGGMFGDGDFWSDVVGADNAIVEYLPTDPELPLPFSTSDLAHFGMGTQRSLASVLKETRRSHR